MNPSIKTAWEVIAAALVLGLAGRLLFADGHAALLDSAAPSSFGPNLLIWTVLGITALTVLAKRSGISLDAQGRWLAVPLCLFAASFMIVGSAFLQFWSGVLAATSGLLLITRCRGPWKITLTSYTEYLRLAVLGAAGVVTGPLLLAFKDLKATPDSDASPAADRNSFARPAVTVFKGGLLAVVPVAVFGSLFVGADPVFGNFVQHLFDWDPTTIVANLFWTALFGLIAAGLLRTALLREPIADLSMPESAARPKMFFSASDVIVALTLIDLLFALFVSVQFKFLFGGQSIVQSVHGLTYASYARGGFFELAWVAGLALPVLLLAHWLTRNEAGRGPERVKLMTVYSSACS